MRTLWQIGSAGELVDNYKAPSAEELRWRVGESGQTWPLYQPSEADPETGYRAQTRTIHFHLDSVDAPGYELCLDYLVIAPRVPFLLVSLNGVPATLHLRPKPSQSGKIRLLSGLHTTIYADGTVTASVPSPLLRAGENELTLTAQDGDDTLRVDNPRKVERLDRMANGAGLIYQHLALHALERCPVPRLDVHSSVLYRYGEHGLEHGLDVVLSQPDTDTLTLGLDGTSHHLLFERPAWGDVAFSLWVPDGAGPLSYRAMHGVQEWHGELVRKRKWTVYVSAHSHTDIGYTHRQGEVAERHSRNLDTALDWLEGGEQNFAYHLDSFWPVAEFGRRRSAAQQAKLARWLQSGRIHVAANHVDLLTQFAALEDLIRNQHDAADYLAPLGMTPEVAAVVDVASITSSLPDILSGAGVKYLIHANNQDRGPFRLNGNLHRQSPFFWHGRAGGRVLVWLAKMYCELRKVCGSPPHPHAAGRGLGLWLAEFERPDYAPDAVLLYGQEADNTDLDPQPNDFIAEWNERYAYPKLIPASLTEFFRRAEQFSEQLPVWHGDGGAYWEDGVLTSLHQTTLARLAQADLPAAETLATLAALHDPRLNLSTTEYADAWDNLLLYDEHTWGTFLSVTDPDSRLARDGWQVKAEFATRAHSQAKQLLHTAASRHALQLATQGREIVVTNPHNWPIRQEIEVEIGHAEVPIDPVTLMHLPFCAVELHPTQRVIRFVAEVPSLSFRRYPLQPGTAPMNEPQHVMSQPSVTLRSSFYKLEFDLQRGCVTRLHDLNFGRELAGADGLAQFIYVTGGEGSRMLSNQSDLPLAELTEHTDFELLHAEQQRDALGETLRFRARVAQGELSGRIHLPSHSTQIDLDYTYDKQLAAHREAAYMRFDLNLSGATVESDSQLGWVDWTHDRLPGACLEWLPLQTGVFLSTPENGVFLASPDVPLFTAQDIVRGHWPKDRDLKGGRIYSYLLNNYWHTNYQGRQAGPLRFRYVLTSGETLNRADLSRLGRQTRRGLYAQRLSFQDFREPLEPYASPAGGTLAQLHGEVILSTLKPARDGRGVILRVQNPTDSVQNAHFRIAETFIRSAQLTDLSERNQSPLPVEDGSLTFSVPPWGVRTVRLHFASKEENP